MWLVKTQLGRDALGRKFKEALLGAFLGKLLQHLGPLIVALNAIFRGIPGQSIGFV